MSKPPGEWIRSAGRCPKPRGLEMTRLEVFTDAAFAFATTRLVISLSGIPSSVSDLVAALFAWISGGWLPSSFALREAADLPRLFAIYWVGFLALTGLIALLYIRALRAADRLALSEFERVKTRSEVVSFCVLAATGLVSCLWAMLFPLQWGIWAGFWYVTLPVTMPLVAVLYDRKARRVAAET